MAGKFVGMTGWENRAIHAINPSATYRAKGIDNIEWFDGTAPIAKADIQAKAKELEDAYNAAEAKKVTDKANAKAKLIAGEALTEAEADTIVL